MRGHRAGIRERHRVRMHFGGHKAREMGHVNDEGCIDLVGDLAKAQEVQVPGVARPTGEEHLRAVAAGELGDLVHVHETVLPSHVVGKSGVVAPGRSHISALARVSPMGEIEPEHGLAWLAQGMEHRRIRVRPRIRRPRPDPCTH